MFPEYAVAELDVILYAYLDVILYAYPAVAKSRQSVFPV